VRFHIPKPRIPDSTSKNFPEYGFPKNKFYGFRNPYSLIWAKGAKESIGTAWYREKIDQ